MTFLSKNVRICVRGSSRGTQATHWARWCHITIILVGYFDLHGFVCNRSLRALPRVSRGIPGWNRWTTSSVYDFHTFLSVGLMERSSTVFDVTPVFKLYVDAPFFPDYHVLEDERTSIELLCTSMFPCMCLCEVSRIITQAPSARCAAQSAQSSLSETVRASGFLSLCSVGHVTLLV